MLCFCLWFHSTHKWETIFLLNEFKNHTIRQLGTHLGDNSNAQFCCTPLAHILLQSHKDHVVFDQRWCVSMVWNAAGRRWMKKQANIATITGICSKENNGDNNAIDVCTGLKWEEQDFNIVGLDPHCLPLDVVPAEKVSRRCRRIFHASIYDWK